jgi:hypothetical protein
MNPMSSATIEVGVLRLPAPAVAANPAAMERWYYNLSPLDRGRFANYLQELVKRLPMSTQLKVQKKYEQLMATNVGLGWVAGVVTALGTSLVQAGTSIYQGREQADLQRELTGMSISGQLQTAALREAFAAEVANAQTEAMQSAAQTAGQAQVLTAQQAAQAAVAKTQVITGALKPVIIGTAVVGGLVAFMLIRKRKR